MATKLNGKKLTREILISGVPVLVTFTGQRIEFRKPGTRKKAWIDWTKLVRLYALTDTGERPLRSILGVGDMSDTAPAEAMSMHGELTELRKKVKELEARVSRRDGTVTALRSKLNSQSHTVKGAKRKIAAAESKTKTEKLKGADARRKLNRIRRVLD